MGRIFLEKAIIDIVERKMQKKLNINTVLKVITQELPKEESRNVFEKIMAGYFYEKKLKQNLIQNILLYKTFAQTHFL